jgi:hypothetical protein
MGSTAWAGGADEQKTSADRAMKGLNGKALRLFMITPELSDG